jgi:cyclophilin family peptidyl-prolyl cis-trans isomerase
MRAPRLPFALAAVLVTGGLVACGGGEESTTAASDSPGCEPAPKPAPKQADFKAPAHVLEAGARATATVETTCGTFVIELDTKHSPKTSNSFAFLAERGAYDDTWFQRIVPGLLIQGGDPQQNGTGDAGYKVIEPPPPNTAYLKDFVGMGKSGIDAPGTSGSQFFVVTAADAGFPPDYALLGQVVRGADVVDRIGELGDPASGEAGTPLEPVVIKTIEIDED